MSTAPAYLRLSDDTAARVFGAGSGVNRNSLRHAARTGRLTITRIAGKQFTTETWLHEFAARMAQPAVADHAGLEAEDAEAAVARAEAAIASLKGR